MHADHLTTAMVTQNLCFASAFPKISKHFYTEKIIESGHSVALIVDVMELRSPFFLSFFHSFILCFFSVTIGQTSTETGSGRQEIGNPRRTARRSQNWKGKESWSSGYGRRLMFQRSWLRIPVLNTGCTFFHI